MALSSWQPNRTFSCLKVYKHFKPRLPKNTCSKLRPVGFIKTKTTKTSIRFYTRDFQSNTKCQQRKALFLNRKYQTKCISPTQRQAKGKLINEKVTRHQQQSFNGKCFIPQNRNRSPYRLMLIEIHIKYTQFEQILLRSTSGDHKNFLSVRWARSSHNSLFAFW